MVKNKKSFASILQSLDGERERKLARKLPGWSGLDVLVPSALALEQCSSSAAASYKAAVALEWAGGRLGTVCDITGGLGSDASAFAAVADKVVYYEKNPALVDAARHNCSVLGIDNIEFHCEEIGEDSNLPECEMAYADPARRDVSGRKVFRLEDCSPDIGALAPGILEKACRLMVKLSPMADISVLLSRFGGMLEKLHVVSIGGEVKELLCLLRSGASFAGIRVVELGRAELTFEFMPEDEDKAVYVPAEEVRPGQLLLEPSAGILKSGAFKLLCSRFGICKLAPSTHLYVSGGIGGNCSPVLPPETFFRRYIIERVLPLNAESTRLLRSSCLEADVSARNIRMDSAELMRRIGCRPGGGKHIFGCHTDCSGNLLIVARRICGDDVASC